ncbi:MAG: class I SAM-dependent methyltransferase [Candidatus Rokuibacteriota bacterium]
MWNTTELLRRLLADARVPCEVVLPSGETLYGGTAPAFRVTIRSSRALRGGLDEFSLGKAYVEGDIDIEGDMLSLLDVRARLADRRRLLPLLRLCSTLFLRPATSINRRVVSDHYSFGDDFYLTFMDSRYRLYSHGHFESGDETIEQASERKLARVYETLQLKPGMRLLDIGAGWGGVTEYCGTRGVHVTSLTLGDDSFRYIQALIRRHALPGEVLLQDFLTHRPGEPYDAIVILGVIEHIPYYRRFAEQVWACLRPGGLLYLDGSATREKFDMSRFTRHYIWHGTHTFMCLQDVLQELLYAGMEVRRLRQERHDYYLSMRQWAQRFDANRERVIARWGEGLYRAWRVYLWGACHAFHNDILQAYQLVALRGPAPGPRPGLGRRVSHFVRGLASR